jgi:SAM-dependent methyltransferase
MHQDGKKMKKYFEYPINEKIENKLKAFYEDETLEQHNSGHILKAGLNIGRIKKLTEFKIFHDVLDFGCSRGEIIIKLSNEINSGMGMDISKSVINKNIYQNNKKNISFKVYNGKNLKLNRRFDRILLIDVLEHISNPDNTLLSLKNYLSKDGEIVIQVPSTGWLSNSIFEPYHQGHLRYYDPDYLSEYLKEKGFKIKKIRVYNSVPLSSFFIKFNILFKILDITANLIPPNMYPYFGEILVIASKNEN